MFTDNKGIKLALITAVVSGISVFINKFAVSAMPSALLFTATKNTLVALFIVGILLSTKKITQIKFLSKRELALLFLIGIIGGSIPFYLFFTGLALVPAVNAALIHKTLVLWVALMAYPLLKEKLSKVQMIGLLLLFGSNLLVGGFKGFEFSRGEFMVLAATLLWSVENIIAKKVLSSVDSDIVTGSRMGLGALLLLGMTLLLEPQSFNQLFSLSTTQILWILATAITLMAYVQTWYKALQFAPAVTVSTILVSATIVTNILSAIFITHVWKLNIMIPQVVLVSVGLVLFVLSSKKADQRA